MQTEGTVSVENEQYMFSQTSLCHLEFTSAINVVGIEHTVDIIIYILKDSAASSQSIVLSPLQIKQCILIQLCEIFLHLLICH